MFFVFFFTLSLAVEVCFIFSVLATYAVSVNNKREWPEGKTAGEEDSEREKWVEEKGENIEVVR